MTMSSSISSGFKLLLRRVRRKSAVRTIQAAFRTYTKRAETMAELEKERLEQQREQMRLKVPIIIITDLASSFLPPSLTGRERESRARKAR